MTYNDEADAEWRRRAPIEQEVLDHPTWCSDRCQTFLPGAYREKRQCYSAETVQRDYDLCHIWR